MKASPIVPLALLLVSAVVKSLARYKSWSEFLMCPIPSLDPLTNSFVYSGNIYRAQHDIAFLLPIRMPTWVWRAAIPRP